MSSRPPTLTPRMSPRATKSVNEIPTESAYLSGLSDRVEPARKRVVCGHGRPPMVCPLPDRRLVSTASPSGDSVRRWSTRARSLLQPSSESKAVMPGAAAPADHLCSPRAAAVAHDEDGLGAIAPVPSSMSLRATERDLHSCHGMRGCARLGRVIGGSLDSHGGTYLHSGSKRSGRKVRPGVPFLTVTFSSTCPSRAAWAEALLAASSMLSSMPPATAPEAGAPFAASAISSRVSATSSLDCRAARAACHSGRVMTPCVRARPSKSPRRASAASSAGP